jgi:two-component system nitrate/nitrite response regulator NarL
MTDERIITQPARSAGPAQVVIFSDTRVYLEALSHVISSQPGLGIVAAERLDERALHALTALAPDIALVDISTDAGLALLRPIGEQWPEVKIATLGVTASESDVLHCVRAGVAGYISRDDSVQDLIAALLSVARGELYCPPSVAGLLRRRTAALAAGAHFETRLTSRETEIARLLQVRRSNREIARHLRIEESTVKNHIHSIFEKLRVHRRDEVGRRLGLAAPMAGDDVALGV